MEKPDIFMPLYIGDYLRDTMHLTTVQHGCYFLLIVAAWPRGGTLPDDNERLAAIARLPLEEWMNIRPVLQEFFQMKDREWIHKRVQKEREKAMEQKEKFSTRAQKAASARWEKEQQNNATSNAQAMLEECPSPSPSPSTASLSSSSDLNTLAHSQDECASENSENPKQKSKYPSEFERFWKEYPRKKSKGTALKAWQKALDTGATNGELIAAVLEAKEKNSNWKNDQYIPYPASWLSGRGWEDEFTSSALSANGKWNFLSEKDYTEGLDEHGNII